VTVALLPVLWAVFSLVNSAVSIPSGDWSDRVGRKPLIVAGWLIYAVVYLLLGVATTVWEVWVLFLVYGLHFGLTEGVEKALVADLVPPAERGAAFGWYHFMIGLGTLPASILFGAVWARYGVRSAFTMGALIALAAAIALVLLVPTRITPARAASRAPDGPAPRR
jgi:MFS family permease